MCAKCSSSQYVSDPTAKATDNTTTRDKKNGNQKAAQRNI